MSPSAQGTAVIETRLVVFPAAITQAPTPTNDENLTPDASLGFGNDNIGR